MFQGAWRVLAIAAAAMFVPEHALCDETSDALITVRDGAVGLDLNGGRANGASTTDTGTAASAVTGNSIAPNGVAGSAALTLDLPDLPIHLKAGARTENAGVGGALRQEREATADVEWTGVAPVTVTAEACARTEVTPVAPLPGFAVSNTQTVTSNTRTAAANAQLPLGGGLTAELGAAGTATEASDASETAGLMTGTRIKTSAASVFAGLDRRLSGHVKASAGVREQSLAIGWRGANAGGRNYGYLTPDARIEAQPWAGASLRAEAGESVTPYNGAAYAAFADAQSPGSAPALEPNHAWRYGASFEQNVGDAKIGAAYTQLAAGTATEIGESTSGPVPQSVPQSTRSETNVTISLPLSTVGLAGFSLSSDTTLRSSRLKDPVTGSMRRASGEVPFETHVMLSRDLNRMVAVGITGGFMGPVKSYLPNQMTTVDGGVDAGAFLRLKPGPFEVDIDASGLAGMRSGNDTFYAGTRATSAPGLFGRHEIGGPTLTLALKKSL